MTAANYTPEEESRYRLASLPDPPFISKEEALRLNREYEAGRARHRITYPAAPKVD